MYISLKQNKNLLCEVGIYTIKADNIIAKPWSVSIHSYINIENYSNALLKISEELQQDFIKDFKMIQGFRQDYFEQISKEFPVPNCYDLSDENLTKDEFKIICIIREKIQKLADKWNMEYNED